MLWESLEQSYLVLRHNISEDPPSLSRIFLVSDDVDLRSALSFRLAYEAAATGSTVLYVCRSGKFESPLRFPTFVDINCDPSVVPMWETEHLSRIIIKYLTNSQELKLLLASIHVMQPRPHCIVIDDFTGMICDHDVATLHPLDLYELFCFLFVLFTDFIIFFELDII